MSELCEELEGEGIQVVAVNSQVSGRGGLTPPALLVMVVVVNPSGTAGNGRSGLTPLALLVMVVVGLTPPALLVMVVCSG